MLTDLEPVATSVGAYAFVVFLGLLWGSFANVCIYRWPPTTEFPKGRSVVAPGSHCFVCKTPIRWYDNVPLLSWLWLRGKCRSCKTPFSARYLIVEALTGALFGVAWWMAIAPGSLTEPFTHQVLHFAINAAFCFTMVVIAFIDIDTKLILNKLTIPSIVIFYALGIVAGRPWWVGLVGVAVGYGVPWAVGEIYFIASDRDGLGLGDSMLLAVIGAPLGWKGVIASLFLGAISGSVVGVLALLRTTSSEPGSARRAAVPVIAVAATVAATVTGLKGMYVLTAIACVIAIAMLVLSRRMEPAVDESPDAPVDATASDTPPPAFSRVPGLLALLSGLLLLGAVASFMLRAQIPAIASAAVGAVVLFVARRQHQKMWAGVPEEPERDQETDAEGPSVLRTELPFGPFLALGAVFYVFAEPWIAVQLRFLGV
ncbi:MAG TPA: prepilin peptidase [Kofleriaceae bacterium]